MPSSRRGRFYLVWILLGLLAPSCHLGAADAWEAAKARHAWTWFALSEAQAVEQARRLGGTLVIGQRDGQPPAEAAAPPPGLVVTVHLHTGRVLWAQMVQDRKVRSEGVGQVTLLPWLGLPEAEAQAQVRAAGRAVRVVARDGQDFPVTLDFNAERVNLHVMKGVVVAITPG